MRSASASRDLQSDGPRLISPNKRHEPHRQELPCPDLSLIVEFEQDQALEGERSTDWDHHSASRLELPNQRWRDLARCRGDDNTVERRRLLPTVIAVAESRRDVVVTKALQSLRGGVGKGRDNLDRVDFARETREDGGLIARASADLQHNMVRPDLQEVGHQGDDEWLRDGLAVTDRQRTIGISLVPHSFRHELMPRHKPHGLEYPRGNVIAANG